MDTPDHQMDEKLSCGGFLLGMGLSVAFTAACGVVAIPFVVAGWVRRLMRTDPKNDG
jgi:hypothetical protein